MSIDNLCSRCDTGERTQRRLTQPQKKKLQHVAESRLKKRYSGRLNVALQHKTHTGCACDIVMSHLGTVATGIAFFLRPYMFLPDSLREVIILQHFSANG